MPKLVDHAWQCRELAATAASVVASDGLEHTTLRAVAARHGCTKGMVQHYFRDKDTLLLGVMDHVEDLADSRMPRADDNHVSGLDLVHARLACLLPVNEPVVREWQVRLAFNNPEVLSAALRANIARRRDDRQRRALSDLRRAQRRRELRDGATPLNAYRSLNALVSGIGLGAVMDPQAYPPLAQRRILHAAIDDLRR